MFSSPVHPCSDVFVARPRSPGCAMALAATALLQGAPAPALAGADQLPIEHFFREVDFQKVRLSPDGKHIAAIVRLEAAPQARNIVVMDVETRAARAITGYEEEDVRDHNWVNSDRLMLRLDRYADDPDRPTQSLGMFTVLKDGSGGAPVRQRDRRSLRSQTAGTGGLMSLRYLDRMPHDDRRVLMVGGNELLMFPNVYECDVKNGRARKVEDNDISAVSWVPDNKGRIRAAVTAGENRDDLHGALVYRPDETAEWRTLRTFYFDDLRVFGFDADDRHLFVATREPGGRHALYRVDTETGEFGEPVVADDIHDVVYSGGELHQTRNGKAVFFRYMADRPRYVFLEESWAERQAALDQALPDTDNAILDWSDDEERFLVFASSARDPGSYYLYDEARGKLQYLLSPRGWIEPETMSPMRPVSFEARDGTRVHGYLTIPLNTIGDGPPPLVVHPHGGPYGIRDSWGFDPDVQFLASRGYAVFQINFRGSGGYGGAFQSAGYRRWGLEMQDDLTDGVRWAVEQGLVDGDRVCIYGASYGGYATMAGLTKTPDLYRCGINYVGVVDLRELHKDARRTFGIAGLEGARNEWLAMAIGDPQQDKARFYETSPINFIERIEAPVLVIHGQMDGTVPIEHFRRLTGQLQRHDKEFEAIVKRHEGHGFQAAANKIELYTAIERFLAKHL